MKVYSPRIEQVSSEQALKIGLMLFLSNDRENNSKRPYDSIRAVAKQAEADGFDSIWLPGHFIYRDPGRPTRGIWECWTTLAALAEALQLYRVGLRNMSSRRNSGSDLRGDLKLAD